MVYNKFIYGQENGHDTIDHIGKEDHGMKERFYRFMQGRYGQDAFSRFLLGITGLCLLFNVLLHNRFLGVLAWALLIYTYYRIFSKNHSARYEENQRYLQGTAKARYWADQQKKLWQERRYHHIYTCPKCRQKIRIPRGKGRIMARCPKCQHEFQKRS